MTARDFYCLTAAEYVLKARGHRDKTIRQWEHTRLIIHTIAQSNSSKALPAPEIWMPLPTDGHNDALIDPDKLNSIWEKAKKRHGKRAEDTD